MTNKEDEDKQYDPGMIALIAMHFVSQVLDEAYVIANTARESGQSWRYLRMLKNTNGSEIGETLGDISIASHGDSEVNENKMNAVANIIATSTPQKNSDEKKLKIESTYIGQGDEELEIELEELTNSTSTFIHDLFDMTKADQAITYDCNEIIQKNAEQDLSIQAISKEIDAHINTALNLALEHDLQPTKISTEKSSSNTEHSDFSFLADAFFTDICKEEEYRLESEESYSTEKYFMPTHNISEITEIALQNLNENVDEMKPEHIALNENVYLTMNRDYEQYSEDDADTVLQDPRGLTLLEVELMTASTSGTNYNLSPTLVKRQIEKPQGLLAATVISATNSRKSGLVRRCRYQGARFLSCLRGWWRSKSTKRKEGSGTVHGAFPLSPDARRRMVSTLGQRLLRPQSPSNSESWKFNTVNEAIVTSTRWKDYTFENKTDEFGDK